MADRDRAWRGFGAVWADLARLAGQARAAVAKRPEAALLAVGLILRLWGYLGDRQYWLDEGSLFRNIEGRTGANLFSPMVGTQLVPPGFLAVEVGASALLGTGRKALRLFPMLCGVGALFGFAALAGRVLGPNRGAVLSALALFAVSGDLVYYSSELKPYATDVSAAVACALAGVAALPALGRSERRAPTFLGLGALGVVVVWLSFPSAVVLAGVGTTLIVVAVRRRDWAAVGALAAVALAWLVSFAGSYALALRLLGPGGREGMTAFWAFAFPPRPPGSVEAALWPFRRAIYLFANPLDFYSRRAPSVTAFLAIPAAALAGLGFVSLWRRSPTALAVLTLPLVFALGAAYPRLYPFHGRLALYLAPSLVLLIGEGAARFARPRWALALTMALLLTPQLSRYAYRFIQSGADTNHNHVGDLRPGRPGPERFPF